MIRPSVENIQRERYSPAHVGKELVKQSHDILRDLAKLPADVGRLVGKMGSDRFTVTLEHQDLPQFAHVLNEISKRLAFAIVIGALIIGSSMILVAGIKQFVASLVRHRKK